MIKVALKGLLARKWRLLLTSIAIIIGVAFIVGTSLLGTALDNSIRGQIADTVGKVDVVVRASLTSGSAGDNGPGGDLRPILPSTVLDQVSAEPGVAAADPLVSTQVSLYGPDKRRIGGGFGPPTILINFLADDVLNSFKITQGSAPSSDDEVVVDVATAKDSNLVVGDRVRVTASGGDEPLTISGIAGVGADGTKEPGTPTVLVTLASAQKLASRDGGYDAIFVRAASGTTQSQLRDTIAPTLPAGTEAITGAAYVDEQQKELSQILGFLTGAISAFGWVSEFAACFVIYNTFNIIVTQRLKELALFRALGASKRQVLGSVLLEATGVGVIAGVVGLFLGWGLSVGLVNGLGSALKIPSDVPGLSPGLVLLALLIGVIVTVVSALIPAFRATRIPPVAAMTEAALDRSALSWPRRIIGALILVGGVSAVVVGNEGSMDNPLPLVGFGAALIFIAVVVGGPVLVKPLVTAIGAPLTLTGMGGRLARDNAARNPKRTIATAVVLTIGVALITIVSVIASSLKDSVDTNIRQAFAGIDAIVGDPIDGQLPPGAADKIAAVPEVAASSALRFGPIVVLNSKAALEKKAAGGPDANNGESDFIGGVDGATYLSFIDLGNVTPKVAGFGDDEAIVLAKAAADNNWKVGDEIVVANPTALGTTAPTKWKIVATYERQIGPSILVDIPTFNAATPPQFHLDSSIYVQAKPGVDSAALVAGLSAAMSDSPDTSINDIAKFIERRTQFFDVILGIIYVLMLLTIIVAAIGVVNTIGLSVIERRREIGLLRAVGMPRGQLGRTVMAESGIIAFLGTLIGVVIGIALAISFVNAFDIDSITPVIPWISIIVICVLGILGGVVSGLWPAWRAARTDILDAIATS